MALPSMYECVGVRADLYQQVLYLLGGGRTKRFHTIDTIKDVTVGHHQYTVAWLCYLLTEFPTMQLIMAALVHDTAEQVGGDVPSPTKRLLGFDNEMYTELETMLLKDNGMHFVLSAEEQQVLSVADKFAGMLECVHERNLGNKNAELPYARWHSYLTVQALTAREVEVMAMIGRLWQEALN